MAPRKKKPRKEGDKMDPSDMRTTERVSKYQERYDELRREYGITEEPNVEDAVDEVNPVKITRL